MKDKAATWRASKFDISGSDIRPSTDRDELAPSSRVIATLVAEFYTRTFAKWISGDLADLGCGKAPFLGAYRKYCDSILLVDWDNSAHPNPLLDHRIDLNEGLAPIESGSLDTVLLSDVLEHIREPQLLLAEIARILRPGGRLLLNVPFTYRLHEDPHDYYRYTSYALEYMIMNAGLEIVELSPLGGWFEIMADMWSKLFSAIKLPIMASIIHRVSMLISRTAVGRRFASISAQAFPLGYGLIAQKPSV